MSRSTLRLRTSELYSALEKKAKTGTAGTLSWSLQKPLLTRVHRGQRWLQPDRYTDADPYKLLYVDPESIQYHVNRMSTPRVFGTVAGGDWDQQREPFSEVDIYESLVQRFRHGASWEDTEIFETLLEEPDGRLWTRVCESDVERRSRLREIDELYQAISVNGYLTQRQLLEQNPAATSVLNNEECHPILNEIGVNIGRDGTLLWRHRGLHRLSITKILGLDRVPVLVLARHREWQKLREQPNKAEKSVLSHPDLQDITNDQGGDDRWL
jgi:hypothetical protein